MMCGNKNSMYSHEIVFMKEIICAVGGATGSEFIFSRLFELPFQFFVF